MLMTVYDAKGEPFEVRPHIAKHLILDEGWSPTPVPMKAPETPKDEAVFAASVEPAPIPPTLPA